VIQAFLQFQGFREGVILQKCKTEEQKNTTGMWMGHDGGDE
jgi:hypothetical protein